jgi:hypothetical protein
LLQEQKKPAFLTVNRKEVAERSIFKRLTNSNYPNFFYDLAKAKEEIQEFVQSLYDDLKLDNNLSAYPIFFSEMLEMFNRLEPFMYPEGISNYSAIFEIFRNSTQKQKFSALKWLHDFLHDALEKHKKIPGKTSPADISMQAILRDFLAKINDRGKALEIPVDPNNLKQLGDLNLFSFLQELGAPELGAPDPLSVLTYSLHKHINIGQWKDFNAYVQQRSRQGCFQFFYTFRFETMFDQHFASFKNLLQAHHYSDLKKLVFGVYYDSNGLSRPQELAASICAIIEKHLEENSFPKPDSASLRSA